MPLGLKYACPSESTWKLAVSSLLKVLSIGLPVARQHASSGKFDTMWPELANAFEDFLFTKRYRSRRPSRVKPEYESGCQTHLVCFPFYSTPPDNLSIQEFQKNEAIDVEVNACSWLHCLAMISCGGLYQHCVLFILGGPADQHRDLTVCQFHPQRLCRPDHGYAQ